MTVSSQSPPADPFDIWSDLKINTRLRLAQWLDDGTPERYPAIDSLITMAEHAGPFRSIVPGLAPAERRDLKALVMEQLRIEGYKDLKIPQVPETRWNKRLKGARPIAWLPGAVAKEC